MFADEYFCGCFGVYKFASNYYAMASNICVMGGLLPSENIIQLQLKKGNDI